MAAISSITPVPGVNPANEATLSASDTITVNQGKTQLLVLRNPAGSGTITATVKGADSTSTVVPGIGTVSLSSGVSVAVPFGESRAVVLGSVSAYLQGAVTITGGATLKMQLFDL